MPKTGQQSKPRRTHYSLWSVGVILFLVILLLLWHTNRSYQVFQAHQRELMLRSVDQAGNEIKLFLGGIRRSLKLFVTQNRTILETLVKNPENEALYSLVEAKVEANFPEYYAFSQADQQGHVIFNDFDAPLGHSCQKQVQRLLQTDHDQLSVHRHSEGLHFDILVRGKNTLGEARVFILSILIEHLEKILVESQVPGQRLLVLHQNNPGLIEVNPQNQKQSPAGVQHLSGNERAQIFLRRPITETLWDLVVFQDPALLQAQRKGMVGQVFIALLGFGSVSLVLISLIKKEEQGRMAAEQRLSASHSDLARLVAERTKALYALNQNLELEINERKTAQEQARQRHESELGRAWRLNTMGEMAVELAHEISQPLAAISNYTRGCIRRLRNGTQQTKEIIHALEQAADQAELAGRVIHRFRGLLRKDAPKHELLDVNRAVREVIDLVRLEADRALVEINWHPLPALPSIQADRIQIAQVIINLVRNSIDALASQAGPRKLLLKTTREETQIQLRVEDNGKGLPETNPEQVFQRFFTTKQGGMGMGLAMGRSIIESHGGTMWAEPVAGGGAAFLFRLPACGDKRSGLAKKTGGIVEMWIA